MTLVARKIRVFLVDDHPLVCDWLRNLLGMEPDLEVVGEAANAPDAIAAIAAAAIDVAVVDLSLKRGSGLDVIKALKAQSPDTRVLVLSMHEGIGDIERALKAGARGYVMKGASSTQIVPAIRWVHAGKIHASPEVFSQLAERMANRARGAGLDRLEALSDRELDVFRRLGEGQSTRRIADDLAVSQKTVQTYCARIKQKIGVDDATELSFEAIRWRATLDVKESDSAA